ncbi:GNAT family N-acetyltransferase [Bacillus sp. V3B]|uniref:GNAT family N-acetyltransferase n=1 Tax=Bacillus sp. V3B TaxID=2804915 RepID=UPI00210A67F8|nr:GNAT family N-acetyltransferase [Bacillus sp. V3B]MCQ6276867.1 GNAT family N-acetyltransferase [Bacillus sp. V3B]
MDIRIRNIQTMEDFEKVLQLDLKVWGGEPVPVHQTLTAAKNGGIVLGAFAKEQLVGFLYSFPGFKNGETYLCSHMMGIDADYRNQGIGAQLKLKQAEKALRLGYKMIRWTFDPLQSRNGYLNIAKLGAICSEYIENCYGEMNDGLNKNMPSDRFNVEWLIDHPYRKNRQTLFADVAVKSEGIVLGWKERKDGFPEAFEVENQHHHDSSYLFVPVPVFFQQLKEQDAALAFDWRLKIRAVFQPLFADGWAVVHVVRKQDEPVQYYVLCKRERLAL